MYNVSKSNDLFDDWKEKNFIQISYIIKKTHLLINDSVYIENQWFIKIN